MGLLLNAAGGAPSDSIILRARGRHNSENGPLKPEDYLKQSGMWNRTLARRGILHDTRNDPDDLLPEASSTEEAQQTNDRDTTENS